MAGRAMAVGDGFQKRHLAKATIGFHRAARIEMTAGRRIERARDLAVRLGARHLGIGAMEGIGEMRSTSSDFTIAPRRTSSHRS